jgi:hypothetical protein
MEMRSNGDFGGAAIAAGFASGKKDIKKSAYLYLMWLLLPGIEVHCADFP